MSNDTLYISAPRHGQGKIYLFTENTTTGKWVFTDSIEPTDPQALRFGTSIAQNDQSLIIGAPYTNAPDSPSQTIASETNSSPQARFAISKGDVFDPGIESGAIYIYENKQGIWQQTARINDANRETGDRLGQQLVVEGNTMVATLNQKDVWDHLRAGAAYIYKKIDNIWHEDTALTAEPSQLGGNFGTSLSLFDQHILVGANKTHSNGFNAGRVFLFSNKTEEPWSLVHKQTNTDIKANDQFGLNVALENDYMLIASTHAVYAYQNTPIPQEEAIFYNDTNTLHLNEVAVEELGVFSATLQLNPSSENILLSLTANHLRTGIESSEVNYSTGQLTIPRLAVQQMNGNRVFYNVILQQVPNSETLQFQVISLNKIQ